MLYKPLLSVYPTVEKFDNAMLKFELVRKITDGLNSSYEVGNGARGLVEKGMYDKLSMSELQGLHAMVLTSRSK